MKYTMEQILTVTGVSLWQNHHVSHTLQNSQLTPAEQHDLLCAICAAQSQGLHPTPTLCATADQPGLWLADQLLVSWSRRPQHCVIA